MKQNRHKTNSQKANEQKQNSPKTNDFWKVCVALDNEIRIDLLRFLMETKEHPCVIEIAGEFSRRRSIGVSVVCQYLKKLAAAGLAMCKRSDKRIYYRAFASSPDGERLNAALRAFFEGKPNRQRIAELLKYVHALSHVRRNAVVRCLDKSPGLSLIEIARATEMPQRTVFRLLAQLAHARIVSAERTLLEPSGKPEAMFLSLTLA